VKSAWRLGPPGSVLDNAGGRAENQAMKIANNGEWRLVK
jgi:hypothetical protein